MTITTGTKSVLDASGNPVAVKTVNDSADSTTSPAHGVIHGTNGQIVSSANPLPILVAAPSLVASDSFSRPGGGDVNQYTVGDIVFNTTAGGAARTIAVAPGNDIAGLLSRCFIKSSRNTTPTYLTFRVHLFNLAVTLANGDNFPLLSNVPGDGYLGSLTTQYMQQFSNCCVGFGAPTEGVVIPYTPISGTANLSYVIEALGAFTPISGETFTLYIPKYAS